MSVSSSSSRSPYFSRMDCISQASSSVPVDSPMPTPTVAHSSSSSLFQELVSLGMIDAKGKVTPSFADKCKLPDLDQETIKRLYELRDVNVLPAKGMTSLTIKECLNTLKTLGRFSPLENLMFIGGGVPWVLGWQYYCSALREWGVKEPEKFFNSELQKKWSQKPPDLDFEAFSENFHAGHFRIIKTELVNSAYKNKSSAKVLSTVPAENSAKTLSITENGEKSLQSSTAKPTDSETVNKPAEIADLFFSKQPYKRCDEEVQSCSFPFFGVDITLFKKRKSEYLSGHHALKIPCAFLADDILPTDLKISPTSSGIDPLQAFFDELLQQLNPNPILDDRGWIRQVDYILKGFVVRDSSVIQQLRSYQFENYHKYSLGEWIYKLLEDCEKDHPTGHDAGMFFNALIATSIYDFRTDVVKPTVDSTVDHHSPLNTQAIEPATTEEHLWKRLEECEKWKHLSEPIKILIKFVTAHRRNRSAETSVLSKRDYHWTVLDMVFRVYLEESSFRKFLLNSLEYILEEPYRKIVEYFDQEFTESPELDPYALQIKVIFRHKCRDVLFLISHLLTKKNQFNSVESYKSTVQFIFRPYQKDPSKQGINLLDHWIQGHDQLELLQFNMFCQQVHPLLNEENKELLRESISVLGGCLERFLNSGLKGGEGSPLKTEVIRGIIRTLINSSHREMARSLLEILKPEHPFTRFIRNDIEALRSAAFQLPAYTTEMNTLPQEFLDTQIQILAALESHNIAQARSMLISVINLRGSEAIRTALFQLVNQFWNLLKLRLEVSAATYMQSAVGFLQQEPLQRRFPKLLINMHVELVEMTVSHSRSISPYLLQEFIFDSITSRYHDIPVKKQDDYIQKILILLKSMWQPQIVDQPHFKPRLKASLEGVFHDLKEETQIQLLLVLNLYSIPISELSFESEHLLKLIENGMKSNALPPNDELSLLLIANKVLEKDESFHHFERMIFFADCFFEKNQFDHFFKCFSRISSLSKVTLKEKKNDLVERLGYWLIRLPESQKKASYFDLLESYWNYQGPKHTYENVFSQQFIQQFSQRVVQFLMSCGSEIVLSLSNETREAIIEKWISLNFHKNGQQSTRWKGARKRVSKEQEIDEAPWNSLFSFMRVGQIAKSHLWKKALEKIAPFSQQLKNYAFQVLTDAIQGGLLDDNSLTRIECWRLVAHTYQGCSTQSALLLLQDGSLINRIYLQHFPEGDDTMLYQDVVMEYHSLYKLCFSSMNPENCSILVRAHGRLCTSRIYMLETIDFWGINEELFKHIQHFFNSATFELFQNTLLNLLVLPNTEKHIVVLSNLAKVKLLDQPAHDPVIHYINELESRYRDRPWCAAVLAEAADVNYPERLTFILKLLKRIFDFIEVHHDQVAQTTFYDSRKQFFYSALCLLIRAIGSTHPKEVLDFIFHPAISLILKNKMKVFLKTLLEAILLHRDQKNDSFRVKEQRVHGTILKALDFYNNVAPKLKDLKLIEQSAGSSENNALSLIINEDDGKSLQNSTSEPADSESIKKPKRSLDEKLKFRIFEGIRDFYKTFHEAEGTAELLIEYAKITTFSTTPIQASPNGASSSSREVSGTKKQESLKAFKIRQEQDYYWTLQKLIHLFNSKSVNSTMVCPSMIGFCMLIKLLEESKNKGYSNIEYLAELLDSYIFEFDCTNPNEFSIFRTLANQLLEQYYQITIQHPEIEFFHFPHKQYLKGVYSIVDYFIRFLSSNSSPIRLGAIDFLLHLVIDNTGTNRLVMLKTLLLHLSALKESPLEKVFDKNLILSVCESVLRDLPRLIKDGPEVSTDISDILNDLLRSFFAENNENDEKSLPISVFDFFEFDIKYEQIEATDDFTVAEIIVSTLLKLTGCLPPIIDQSSQIDYGVTQIDILVRLAHMGIFAKNSENYWEIALSLMNYYINTTTFDLKLFGTKIFAGLLVTNHEIVRKCPLLTAESVKIYSQLHRALIIDPLNLIKTPHDARVIFETLTSVQWRQLLPESKDVEVVKEQLAKIICSGEKKAAPSVEKKAASSVQSRRLRKKKS